MRRAPHLAAFSLLEVMCAVLILGLGVAGMTHGVATALRSSKEAELQTRAALMAAGRIETLRAEGFLTEGELEGSGTQDLASYQWLESIYETDLEGLYEVVVSVRHTESGKPLYELRTLLFDSPLLSSTNATEESASSRNGGRTGGYE
jgi:type II secretory pathway pseudopilin PulG